MLACFIDHDVHVVTINGRDRLVGPDISETALDDFRLGSHGVTAGAIFQSEHGGIVTPAPGTRLPFFRPIVDEELANARPEAVGHALGSGGGPAQCFCPSLLNPTPPQDPPPGRL